MDGTLGRYSTLSEVVNKSGTATASALAAVTTVDGSKAVLKAGEAAAGTIFRWSLGGTKTGTNGTHTVDLAVNGTSVMTLTSDDTSAVDWSASIILYIQGKATQKILGVMLLDTADNDVNYVDGTADMSSGCVLTVTHTTTSGDTATIDFCFVERLGT